MKKIAISIIIFVLFLASCSSDKIKNDSNLLETLISMAEISSDYPLIYKGESKHWEAIYMVHFKLEWRNQNFKSVTL